MKNLFLFISILVFCYLNANGQHRVASQEQTIDQKLKNILSEKLKAYNIYQLDSFSPPEPAEELNMVFSFGDYNWDLVLYANNLQGENHKAFFTRDGEMFQDTIVVATYKGNLADNPEIKARINIWSDHISGYLRDGFEYYYIEPLRDFLKDKTATGIIVFKESDILRHFGENGSYIEEKANIDQLIEPELRSSSTYILELALEADHLFYNSHGSQTNTYMLSVINEVEGLFEDDLGVTFEVVFQNYFVGSTPYNTESSPSNTLTYFRNWWNLNRTNIIRDAAHLFSGKTWGDNYGRAEIGHAGVNACLAYSFSTDTPTPNIYKHTAHELGHQVGGKHELASPNCCIANSSVMCNECSGFPLNTNLYFTQDNIDEITSHITSNTAAFTGVTSFGGFGSKELCTGSHTFTVSNTPSGSTFNWSASPCAYFSNCSGTGTSFNPNTKSSANGEATITVAITYPECGTLNYSKTFWVGKPNYTKLDLITTNTMSFHEIMACDYTSAIAEYDGGNGSAIGIDAYEWNMPYTSNWDIYEEYHAGIDMQYVEIEYWQNPAPGTETINLRAHNTCGWSSWQSIAVDVDDNCGWYLSFTPNPANGETSVSIETNSSNELAHKLISPEPVFDENIEWDIEVFDHLQGPVLKKNKLRGRSVIIPTSTWKSGIYVVRIHYMGRMLTGKLVVEK